MINRNRIEIKSSKLSFRVFIWFPVNDKLNATDLERGFGTRGMDDDDETLGNELKFGDKLSRTKFSSLVVSR